MNEEIHHEKATREPVLSPVDPVSEMLFVCSWRRPLLMAGLGTALVVAINALGG
jgi:hypothetical protein